MRNGIVKSCIGHAMQLAQYQ